MSVRRTVCALLAAFALWQAGSAAWIHAKALLAQALLEHAWSRTLAGHDAVRPWGWADTWPIARLTFPDHGTSMIVLHGASGRNLAFGPAHLGGSAVPGARGNAVVAGHRDTHFAVLERLVPGDAIVLETTRGRMPFRVTRTRVAHERDPGVLRDAPHATLTLVTCYPFDAVAPGSSLRYVVTAERAAPDGDPA